MRYIHEKPEWPNLRWDDVRLLPLLAEIRHRQGRLLGGFEGKFSTSKYAKLAKCSGDTALRDIKILLEQGILVQEEGGGRSTSYRLAEA